MNNKKPEYQFPSNPPSLGGERNDTLSFTVSPVIGRVTKYQESPVYKQYKLNIAKREIWEGIHEVDENMRHLLMARNFCFTVEDKRDLYKELGQMEKCLSVLKGLLR